MNKDENWHILAKYLDVEKQNAENQNVQVLGKDSELNSDFELFSAVNKHFSKSASSQLEGKNKVWLSVEKQLSYEEKKRNSSFIEINYQRFALAASIILLISLSIFLVKYTNRDNSTSEIQYVTAETGDNEILQDTLPDGSIIVLNENSFVKYMADNFNENRYISLQGEGFFDIVRDTDNPFHIKTNSIEIKVLGTSFNVKSANENVEVYVVTGEVQISNLIKKKQEKINLIRGEIGIYETEKNILTKSIKQKNNALDWRKHNLIFRQTPINEVVELLEFMYNVKINLDSDSKEKLTAKFNDQSIESILEIICFTFNLQCKYENEEYLIKRK